MALGDPGLTLTATDSRIHSVDVLRGGAVIGIILVNIFSFAFPAPLSTYFPTFSPRLSDLAAWGGVYMFGEHSFYPIFSMLFGAGLVLFAARRRGRGQTSAEIATEQTTRLFVLGIIGAIHAYVFWTGDILLLYAVCGYLVWRARAWRPAKLGAAASVIGLLSFIPYAFILVGAYVREGSWPVAPEPSIASPERINEEIALFQSNFQTIVAERARRTLLVHGEQYLFLFGWQTIAMMLAGMAVTKVWIATQSGGQSGPFGNGVLRLRDFPRARAWLLSTGVVIGLGGNLAMLSVREAFQWTSGVARIAPLPGEQIAGFVLSCVYIYTLVGWARTDYLSGIQRRLAAIGRVALSAYLSQTAVASAIFFGYGFGFYGELSYAAVAVLAILHVIALLVIAPAWLARYDRGLAEAIWARATAYIVRIRG